MDFSDKVVVVTGGSRGIGRAIALGFAKLGAKIVINYVGNKKAAEETAEAIKTLGGSALLIQADVSKEDQVEEMFKAIVEKWGTVDILVNNAGITKDNILLRMKNEEWDSVIDTNLRGTYLCTKNVVKIMLKKRSGRIINLASVIGIMGNSGQSNYAAAKAGIIGFTKSVAKELASRNITVNAVAPGYIATDMTDGLPEKVKADIIKLIPLQRIGTAEDVANVVIFLSSPAASYITGQVINVDGGMVM
ncbi:MAG TPA: 3-oxoacyl-[acyl-carrier-protein] reductase [Clostridia bacterium]|jgi:3-oxoacyl-[acyl-carrier protein] reductase|nr:3-oxoacyl-[acyl-carrier-protein] reductase [Clostridia bacterium]